MRRGIRDRSYYACNLLPTGVTDADILKAAGLDHAEPNNINPFRLVWKYGTGVDSETILLNPGDKVLLRETEAKAFLRDKAEEGGCLHASDAEKADIKKEQVAALKRAYKFYKDRGKFLATTMLRERNIDSASWDDYKESYWPYYVNEAKSQAVDAYLKEIQVPPSRGPGRPPKSSEV